MNNVVESQNGVFVDGQSAGNAVNANNVLENIIDINNANGLPTNITPTNLPTIAVKQAIQVDCV
ncbi:MAG: hypothetical protein ACRD5B_07835 [Nitrososphaeraceae archaeon]